MSTQESYPAAHATAPRRRRARPRENPAFFAGVLAASRPADHAGRTPAFGLLPLRDPCFSLRSACEQIVLCEQHLNEPDRRCADCISKHLLTAEGHLAEALNLGATGDTRELAQQGLTELRAILRAWYAAAGSDAACYAAAVRLRDLRKLLLPHCLVAV